MKKLTAGIFATILGVTAMGAADAAVTSKGYVDAAVGVVAGDVSALSQTVEGHTTQITNLQTASDTHALKSNVYTKSEVNSALDLKADKSLVGTLPEGTNASTVVGYVDEKTKGIATDETVNALSGRVGALETASATHAIKTDVETALAGKVDNATLNNYVTTTAFEQGQTEQNNAIALKADASALNNYVTTTAFEQGQTAQNEAIALKADASDLAGYVTTTAFEQGQTAQDTMINSKMAIVPAANVTADGEYTLTMKKSGETMVYGWELIQRDGTLN